MSTAETVRACPLPLRSPDNSRRTLSDLGEIDVAKIRMTTHQPKLERPVEEMYDCGERDGLFNRIEQRERGEQQGPQPKAREKREARRKQCDYANDEGTHFVGYIPSQFCGLTLPLAARFSASAARLC